MVVVVGRYVVVGRRYWLLWRGAVGQHLVNVMSPQLRGRVDGLPDEEGELRRGILLAPT